MREGLSERKRSHMSVHNLSPADIRKCVLIHKITRDDMFMPSMCIRKVFELTGKSRVVMVTAWWQVDALNAGLSYWHFFQYWLSLSTRWLFHLNDRTWVYLIGWVILTTDSVILTSETANNIIMLIPLLSCQNHGDFLRQARYMEFHNWTCNRVGTGITWCKFAHYHHVIMSSWDSVHCGYKFNWVSSLVWMHVCVKPLLQNFYQ